MNQLINLSGHYPAGGPEGYITFDIADKKNQKVKIVGTHEHPYFCGKDVCDILGYENVQDAVYKHVKAKHKKTLKTLSDEVQCDQYCIFFGVEHFKNLSFNSGKAVYINEPGLYSLIFACKLPNAKPLKAFMDQYFFDLRYKFGIVDIFPS